MKSIAPWRFAPLKTISGVALLTSIFLFSSCKPTVKVELETSKSENLIQNSIDQDAVDIFRKALDHLAGLDIFSVQVQSSLEDIHETGHRIDLEMFSSITVKRPDKLRTERHSEEFNQLFFYNGSQIALYNPVQKVYASESAPGTIDEMVHHVRDNFGLTTPASDLIYTNAYELLMDEVNHAEIIGKVPVGGVQCLHLLFSRPGVDFQIWIAEKGLPLPHKYVVTDTSTPELLGFSCVFINWDTDPEVEDLMFEFKVPEGTQKIEFLDK